MSVDMSGTVQWTSFRVHLVSPKKGIFIWKYVMDNFILKKLFVATCKFQACTVLLKSKLPPLVSFLTR